jgi:hypothetical protein
MKSLQAATASATSASAQATASSTKTARARSSKQLPKTASTLPLIGLFGLMSFALGLGTHALRKRICSL